MSYLDEMTEAYLECAKWAEEPDEQPARARWCASTFTKAAEKWARKDCLAFTVKFSAMLERNKDERTIADFDAVQVGHDFWLSRNGHGTGFFDGTEHYGAQAVCDELQGLAEAQGAAYIFESRKRLHFI